MQGISVAADRRASRAAHVGPGFRHFPSWFVPLSPSSKNCILSMLAPDGMAAESTCTVTRGRNGHGGSSQRPMTTAPSDARSPKQRSCWCRYPSVCVTQWSRHSWACTHARGLERTDRQATRAWPVNSSDISRHRVRPRPEPSPLLREQPTNNGTSSDQCTGSGASACERTPPCPCMSVSGDVCGHLQVVPRPGLGVAVWW